MLDREQELERRTSGLPAFRSSDARGGIRRVDIHVVCPECSDATTWFVAYNPRGMPERFRQLERDTAVTCSHWRTVHELAWEQAISRRPAAAR